MDKTKPADRNTRAGRRKRVWLISLLVCAAVLVYLAFWGPGVYPVWDRTEIGEKLTTTLGRYYEDHGEYPPYLFGDVNSNPRLHRLDSNPYYLSVNNIDTEGFIPIAPDPLVKGGYLRSYPFAMCSPESLASLSPVSQLNYRFTHGCPPRFNRWRCAFSTPGDFIARVKDGRELDLGECQLADWQLRQRVPVAPESEEPAPVFSSRLFTLGGREFSRGRNTADGELQESLPLKRCSLHPIDQITIPAETLPFFGYQRGEWFGEQEDSAWLWFYGSNWWSKVIPLSDDPDERYVQQLNLNRPDTSLYNAPPRGLDLLNAETGELEPDGIPDGICLLYKLKDGEVVEVIRAEGI
jgi:hypothetical protein